MDRLRTAVEMADLFVRRSARFPVYEVLIAAYVAGSLAVSGVFSPMSIASTRSTAGILLGIVNAGASIPSLLTYILIVKTVAYDIGVEAERGLFLTYLSLPLKRLDFALLRFLVAAGLPIAAFIFSLLTLVAIRGPPGVPPTDVALILLSQIGPTFMFAALVFLLALLLKRGGLALVIAIVVWVVMGVVNGILMFMAIITGSKAAVYASFIMSPSNALMFYYSGGGIVPVVRIQLGFWEVASFLSAHYAISLAILALALYYFVRRYEAV